MTGGVNRLPPVGSIAFSTGACGGGAGMAGGAAVSVTVFVTVSGAGASLLPQAVSTPMARIAPMPAVATRRRAIRPDLMMRPICIVNLNYIVQEIPRQCVDRGTRYALSGVGHAGDRRHSPTVRSCQAPARIGRTHNRSSHC